MFIVFVRISSTKEFFIVSAIFRHFLPKIRQDQHFRARCSEPILHLRVEASIHELLQLGFGESRSLGKSSAPLENKFARTPQAPSAFCDDSGWMGRLDQLLPTSIHSVCCCDRRKNLLCLKKHGSCVLMAEVAECYYEKSLCLGRLVSLLERISSKASQVGL